MEDIVDRLRDGQALDCCSQRKIAANEIERLRKVLRSIVMPKSYEVKEDGTMDARTMKYHTSTECQKIAEDALNWFAR